jgi:hypothetical protein
MYASRRSVAEKSVEGSYQQGAGDASLVPLVVVVSVEPLSRKWTIDRQMGCPWRSLPQPTLGLGVPKVPVASAGPAANQEIAMNPTLATNANQRLARAAP